MQFGGGRFVRDSWVQLVSSDRATGFASNGRTFSGSESFRSKKESSGLSEKVCKCRIFDDAYYLCSDLSMLHIPLMRNH